MATTSLSIPRKMSTPLVVDLEPAHLPAPVRHALEQLQTAIADRACAERDLATAAPADKLEAQKDVDSATGAVDHALQDFAAINAASSGAIVDSAQAAFAGAMERANTAVHAALDALTEASQAASLAASVQPGKAVLRIDGRRAAEQPTRQRLAMVRSNVREVLEQLPDGLD